MASLVNSSTVAQNRSYWSRIWTHEIAVLVLTLLMVIVPESGTANANDHGVCFYYDYDDNGERYCDDYRTMEEIRQRHIRLRKLCREEKTDRKCEATQYFKNGERYFYVSVKICFDIRGENKSRFFIATDAGIEFGDIKNAIRAGQEENHTGSCSQNHEIFEEYFQKSPTYFYNQDGILKYGGKMPQ